MNGGIGYRGGGWAGGKRGALGGGGGEGVPGTTGGWGKGMVGGRREGEKCGVFMVGKMVEKVWKTHIFP